MPINASYEYFEAEKQYHLAETAKEKLKGLEAMLKTAPSHKGAEVLRAGLKQRLSKLRDQLEKQALTSKGRGANHTVKKEGAAQIAFVSIPNAGKSAILSKLTNAKIQVAEHEYSTTKIEMGILDYFGVKLQLLEIPAVYKDFAYKGLGPTYFSAIRNTDLIVIVLDGTKDIEKQKQLIEEEFEKASIKLNKERPPVHITKLPSGGINFSRKEYMQADQEAVIKLLHEHGLHNADIQFYDETNLEQIAEALNESVMYKTAVYVTNKKDLGKGDVSAETGEGLEEFQTKLWKALDMIKIFTKTPGKKKDWPPIALDIGSTIKDLAIYVHREFVNKFKFARIWGKSAKFDGQMQGLTHELEDDDVVELHLK